MSESSPNGGGVMPAGMESVDTGSSEVNVQEALDRSSQRSIDNAERNLSRRAEQKIGFAEGNLELESQLQNVQQKIYKLENGSSTNHLEMMQLQAQAQLLAERLTSSGFTQDDINNRFDESNDLETGYNATDDLVGKYGQESVSHTLNWAAQGGVSTEVAEAFNDALGRNDESSFGAFESLRMLAQNPEYVNTGEHENIGVDLGIANELAEQFGLPGQQLAAISHAIATGKCSRAQAAQMVLRNPELAQTAMVAARVGLIKLSL